MGQIDPPKKRTEPERGSLEQNELALSWQTVDCIRIMSRKVTFDGLCVLRRQIQCFVSLAGSFDVTWGERKSKRVLGASLTSARARGVNLGSMQCQGTNLQSNASHGWAALGLLHKVRAKAHLFQRFSSSACPRFESRAVTLSRTGFISSSRHRADLCVLFGVGAHSYRFTPVDQTDL